MLLRKMLRDMKNNTGQFISIFFMAILAMLVFSGINAEWYGMKTESDKYYEETSLPDIWIMGTNFNKEDIEKIKNLSGISNATLRLSFDSPMDNDNDKIIRINIMADDTLSIPKVVEGSPLDSIKDGLWLDNSFAKANKLKVGEEITFEFAGKKIQKTILGLILHPEYVYSSRDDSTLMPDPENFGFAFLYSSSFSQDFKIPYNQLLITINEDMDEKTISKELENAFSDRYIIIVNRDIHPSVSSFNSEIEQNKAMGGVFPIVFFLIAALSMLTTMTRITNNQRIQIGTLKALGFSRNRILFHYISYGIWIGLIGGLIGIFTGPLLIPPILFSMQKTIYTLPNWSIAISPSSFLVLALLVLNCSASSYFACRRQLNEVPAVSLRPKAPKFGRHTHLEKSKLWHSLDFTVQWNLRDIMRSKIRSFMVIIGVTGCTALLLFGLGLKDTVNSMSIWMYKELNVYESKINLIENSSKEALDALSKSYKGQWIQESAIELRSETGKENGSLTVLDVGEEIRFEDDKRRKISLPAKGIGMSYKMAKLLKINTGDTVEWRSYGEKSWKKSIVSVIYRTPIGQGIVVKRKEYENSGECFKPTALLTSEKVGRDRQIEAAKSIQYKNNLLDAFNDMLESMKMIIAMLVLAAAVLGSVVLYNLGALSFTEKIRELATLKVLGFSPKQIRSLLQMQNIWLTVLGVIIGIPAGYWLVHFMLSTMPAFLDMPPDISIISLFISICGTFILSLIINLMLSKNISKIDMVSALKSVE
ncbi:ABC transporter permease [Proteiniborus sp. MB09-C3]|uniref:ABC transporter permease n=1 Tax=Proteiniborus sp. MB09-C3 TaxID=3050072 RepID=UPI002557ABE2|nr:ABC transporter permease [Proteiniborus sp. MB09-C3]WIV12933.1 ABC transporter permease [Proteiniborus sp. MB09-C3]